MADKDSDDLRGKSKAELQTMTGDGFNVANRTKAYKELNRRNRWKDRAYWLTSVCAVIAAVAASVGLFL